MKIKKVILKKGNLESFFKEIDKDLKRKNMKDNCQPVIYVEDINAFKKILTRERIRVLRAIKEKKPTSVYSLAKMLKRDRSTLTLDLSILQNAGLIELKEEQGIRAMTRPIVNYDQIDVSIEI
jgi:predicted transcriptional regulator